MNDFMWQPFDARRMRLEDKTVVITGAASGIGRSTAERCAEEGARVIVTPTSTPRGTGGR